MKTLTIRFEDDEHADLVLIARVLRTSANRLVRRLVRDDAERRFSDPAFRSKLDQLQADERCAFEARRSSP